MSRVFLLSPARLDGARAKMLLRPEARFDLANALRTIQGAPIGDVFRFVSGLYFRGKLAYGTRFAKPPDGAAWLGSGALVITRRCSRRSSGRGDMSRGRLLLRCVDAGEELAYVAVRGAVRRGTRPPRLEARRR